MDRILLEYPVWFLLLCLLAGLGYAWLLYTAKAPWGRATNVLLGLFRGLLVFAIGVLLLGPFFKNTVARYEQPEVVFAVDNSASLKMGEDSLALDSLLRQTQQLADQINQKDWKTAFYSLEGPTDQPDTLRFDHRTTDLGQMLTDIREVYENRNLSGIVLLSDGLYNQGFSPEFLPMNTKVFTVGLGDTTEKKDAILSVVYANKVAYLGNRFPIAAEVAQFGYAGQEMVVSLLRNDTLIDKQTLKFRLNEGRKRANFLVEADRKGTQRYQLSISPMAGEFTLTNNQQSVYLDILDDRERILIVAASPHPDIKALKSAIEKTKNYEVSTYIPQLAALIQRQPVDLEKPFDLVIYHQLPQIGRPQKALFDKLRAKAKGSLFIVGSQTDLRALASEDVGIDLKGRCGLTDQVVPAFNPNFDRFLFDEEQRKTITSLPPVRVPYGETTLTGKTDVLLYQQIGSVVSDKPLLITHQKEDRKDAVLLGEGLWRWRLQNYALQDNTDAFDQLISKLVQYVASKADKRRFRVYPLRDNYFEGEATVFETEVYNEIYEQIYGQQIELTLTRTDGKAFAYTYTNNPGGFRYQIKGLPPGIYRYTARTMLDGKSVSATGGLIIKELAVESLETRANFNLLRNLAEKTEAQFATRNQMAQLSQALTAEAFKPIVHYEDTIEALLNERWIAIVLILLAALEWGIRKYSGWY